MAYQACTHEAVAPIFDCRGLGLGSSKPTTLPFLPLSPGGLWWKVV